MAAMYEHDGDSASTGSLPHDAPFLLEPDDAPGSPAPADDAHDVLSFEGPEKTLEVCFMPGAGDTRGCRALTRPQLDGILAEARCSILSQTSNQHLDAYVLSESSLFVYAHKVVVKTCGRTTLLRCMRKLLSVATRPARAGGLGLVLEWVGYSRKNYNFPADQPAPHGSFDEELAYLKAHRDDVNHEAFDGSGYVLGPLTGDHWFVYVADQCERPAASATERTLNVMMFDLPEDVTAHFHLQEGEADLKEAGKAMTARAGLRALVPAGASNLDAHGFAPCGYSMNALCFESYTTVHVTPERECSYASFETNTALKSYASLVKNVLAVFKPRRVVLTLFADEAGLRELPRSALFDGLPRLDINGLGSYVRNDLSSMQVKSDCVCMMANYGLRSAAETPRANRARSPSASLVADPPASSFSSLHVGSLQ
mmetsp:Transcript_5892/g.18600  ORF Transcript_5892/g.18600 Transcript_5892/m.18600 type:complete len:427 (-) Transcript_5892:114-1394(-)